MYIVFHYVVEDVKSQLPYINVNKVTITNYQKTAIKLWHINNQSYISIILDQNLNATKISFNMDNY